MPSPTPPIPRTLHKIGAVFSTKTRTLSDWREVLGR